jgi:hypothetical protein
MQRTHATSRCVSDIHYYKCILYTYYYSTRCTSGIWAEYYEHTRKMTAEIRVTHNSHNRLHPHVSFVSDFIAILPYTIEHGICSQSNGGDKYHATFYQIIIVVIYYFRPCSRAISKTIRLEMTIDTAATVAFKCCYSILACTVFAVCIGAITTGSVILKGSAGVCTYA